MEFKDEELVAREIEIAQYLLQHASLQHIGEQTGLSKKILTAHIRNMMKKVGAENVEMLIKILKANVLNK